MTPTGPESSGKVYDSGKVWGHPTGGQIVAEIKTEEARFTPALNRLWGMTDHMLFDAVGKDEVSAAEVRQFIGGYLDREPNNNPIATLDWKTLTDAQKTKALEYAFPDTDRYQRTVKDHD